MVNEAEKYKDEDEKMKDRVQAKNGLESYAYNMNQSVDDEKVKDKISEDDRKTVVDKCEEIIQWIQENEEAPKEDFDGNRKKSKEYVIQLLLNYIKELAVCPAVCLGVCLVVCQGVCLVACLMLVLLKEVL